VELLGDIGSDQKIRELTSEEKDQSFVIRWTCLSLVALRPVLGRDLRLRESAEIAIGLLEMEDNNGRKQAQKIDETFDRARKCLDTIFAMLCEETDPSKEQLEGILHSCESEISELERINIEADGLQEIDWWMNYCSNSIRQLSNGIVNDQLPGVLFQDPDHEINQAVAVEWCRNHLKFPIIRPGQILKSICSFASTFRSILQGHWDPDVYKETLKNLSTVVIIGWRRHPLQRVLWRLQGLGDGGSLGFNVELFFLSLKQLLSTYSSEKSHSPLYIGTFRVITSDWRKHKNSLATQKLLLDMIASNDSIIATFDCPTDIRHEFLVLLGNIFAGQTGPHIDDAVQQLVNSYIRGYHWGGMGFLAKALKVLTHARQAPSL
jgi:hypothetical protein